MSQKDEMELAGYAGLGLLGFIGLKVLGNAWETAKNKWLESWTTKSNDSIITTNLSTVDLLPLAGILALGICAEEGLRYYYKQQAKKRIEYFQIVPHAENKVNRDNISNFVHSIYQMKRTFFQRLTRGREWFQLYFVCLPDEARPETGKIEIYFGFPRDRFSYVKKKLQQSFFKCGLKRVHWTKVPVLAKQGTGGYIVYENQKKVGFPLQEFKGEDQITGVLEQLTPGSAFAITVSPASPRQLNKIIKKTRNFYYRSIGFDTKTMRKSDLDADHKHHLDQLDKRSQKNVALAVRIAVWQEKDAYGDVVHSLRDEIGSRLGGENVGFRLKKTWWNPIQIIPYSLGHFDSLTNWLTHIPYAAKVKPMIWTASELANLLQLPNGMTSEQRAMKEKHLYDLIDHLIPGQSDIPHDQFNEGVLMGYLLNLAQDNRPIYLLEDAMRKMGVVIGKTGGGKTAIALMACIHVIQERLKGGTSGVTIVDPKKSFVYTLLTYLNKLKSEGVLTEEKEELFRFYDVTSEYCFALNPMELSRPNMSQEEKMEIVKNTLEVLTNAYPNDSILFEKYGTVAIQALLEDKQQHTILAISEFLDKESPLRNRLYNMLKHGDTYQKSIAKEIERLSKGFGGTDTQVVYNRLVRLKKSPRMRRIFGQPKTTIKPLENMEQGIITLFNIEGLEEDEIKILMGFITMEYHKAAQNRKNKASNHYLWIDEAHEVQLPVLWKKIIPKDREMGLCLWLLTQSFEQFNDKLLAALTDIGGNFVTCIAGRESAKKVQEITTGRVKATDIQNYRALTASIDTEDKDGDRVTFMIKADPPYVWGADGKPTYYGSDRQKRDDEKNAAYDNAWESLGKPWMKRDCRKVEEVEAEIDRYLESLWTRNKVVLELEDKEAAATKEALAETSNIIDFQKKAVGETNPFAHLVDDNEEDETE